MKENLKKREKQSERGEGNSKERGKRIMGEDEGV